MRRFEDILENALVNTSLKQIMIKVDPKSRDDNAVANEYTGYVLEENPDSITMYLVKPPEGMSNVMTIPTSDSTTSCPMCSSESNLSPLIDTCKQSLVSNGNLDSDSPQLQTLDNVTSAEQLITVMKQYGFEDCEILGMFIHFFDNE